jgi:N-acetylmuramoyl-L-alanine amidase
VKLFISAGHNPFKAGACDNGFCEYDEAVRWVKTICKVLKDFNANYFEVATGTINQKTDFINCRADKNDLAIEIHFNSSALAYHNDNIQGAETLYFPESVAGKKTASIIQTAMCNAGNLKDRGIKEGWYQQDKAKGVIYFLKKTNCVSLVLEPEFIQRKQAIQAMRQAVAQAIADSLISITNSSHRV